MTDNFKDYPKSLNEIKSDKTGNGAEWTPRDVLISMLRQIDSGEIKPDALMICYRETTGPGITDSGYAQCSPDLQTALGLLETTKLRMWTNPNG